MFFHRTEKTHPKHRPLLLSRAMAAADVAGAGVAGAGVGGDGRRWRASLAGVAGRWRASLAGSSSLFLAFAFLPYLIGPWTGAVAFSTIARASSASGGHMHAARATPR